MAVLLIPSPPPAPSPPLPPPPRSVVLSLIMANKVATNNQLDAAFEYLTKLGPDPLDERALQDAAGVGVVITQEEVRGGARGQATCIQRKGIERNDVSSGVYAAHTGS